MNKTLRMATMAVAGIIGCIVVAVSCDKKETHEQDGITFTQKLDDSGGTAAYCEISCIKGSCNSFGGNCFCDAFGYPNCSDAEAVRAMDNSLFDGKIYVTLSPAILQQTKELQDLLYSFGKDYATAVADNLNGIKNIIDRHGHELTTRAGLLAYYELLESNNNYITLFTHKEIIQIEALTNQ